MQVGRSRWRGTRSRACVVDIIEHGVRSWLQAGLLGVGPGQSAHEWLLSVGLGTAFSPCTWCIRDVLGHQRAHDKELEHGLGSTTSERILCEHAEIAFPPTCSCHTQTSYPRIKIHSPEPVLGPLCSNLQLAA